MKPRNSTPKSDRFQWTRSYARASGKSLLFTTEENHKKQQSTSAQSNTYNIPVHNQYDSLSESDTSNEECNQTIKQNKKLNKSNETTSTLTTNPDNQNDPILIPVEKPKPIIIKHYGEDIRKVTERAQAVCKNKVMIKYLGDRYSCKTEKMDDYFSLKEFLTKNNIPHYSYTLDHEKQKIAVIKGLPPTFSPQEVLEEVQNHNDKAISCNQMKKSSNENYPYFMIKFNNNTQFQDVLKINQLFNIRIYWEKYHPKNKTTQCYNCQQYGHGAQNCAIEPKCLKCGKDHKTANCNKPQDLPPSCANCKEQHLSNSKHCIAYKKYREKINKIKDDFTEKRLIKQMELELQDTDNFPLLPPSKNERIKHRTTNARTPTREEGKRIETNSIDNEINDFQSLQEVLREINSICNIKEMLQKAKKLLAKLKEAKTTQDKLTAMLEIIDD